MGRERSAGRDALAAAIQEARREVKAMWAEAREDVRRFHASQGEDELEAAISACLQSQKRLFAAGKRLKDHLVRLRRARKRPGPGG